MLGPHRERAVCDPQQLQSFRKESEPDRLQNIPDPAGSKDWNHDREEFELGVKDFLLETGSDSDGWR
jgi:hypothetical protein